MSIGEITLFKKLIICVVLFSNFQLLSKQRPNIILIMADDVGYECFGSYGAEDYKTPNLDKLASGGARFQHCYSQPLCTPSRVKIMTGQYNVRNYVKFGVLDRELKTFGHLFSRNGYATCIAGKWQLGREKDAPQHFGFDESCLWQHFRNVKRTLPGSKKKVDTRYPNPRLEVNGVEKDYDNGEYGPAIVSDYICDFIERKKETPFFIYYPMILPHNPFPPTPDSKDPNSTNNKQNFVDMVQYIDKIIGKINSKLEELDLKENTLLIFTGDNGTAGAIRSNVNGKEVRGGKGKMTDAGTRVPLIISWPAQIQKAFVSESLVDFSDMLPTICEAAGIEIPKDLELDGHSFIPVLSGEKEQVREWAYVWYKDKEGIIQAWARNQQYKLYQSGSFYDVSQDPLEQEKLMSLSPDQQKYKKRFTDVLKKYSELRTTENMRTESN